jgi:hypothetical protein
VALDQTTLDGRTLSGAAFRPLKREDSGEEWIELGAPCPEEMLEPRVSIAAAANVEADPGEDAHGVGASEAAADDEADPHEDAHGVGASEAAWTAAAAHATAAAATLLTGGTTTLESLDEGMPLENDMEIERGREHRAGFEWQNVYSDEASARASLPALSRHPLAKPDAALYPWFTVVSGYVRLPFSIECGASDRPRRPRRPHIPRSGSPGARGRGGPYPTR